MQRVLVITALIVLVAASLGVGALTANWPFWQRAWQWHAADDGWPRVLPGPRAIIRGGSPAPLHFDPAAADLIEVARSANTLLLLRARDERGDMWSAPHATQDSIVDGRGLGAALLLPLFEELDTIHAGLLDRPIGAWISEWRQDQRGALTPRQLLAHLDGGVASPPAKRPLNPFAAAARLASGPDFHESALAAYGIAGAPPPAAAAQLLARVAAAAEGSTYAAVLEQRLWRHLAAGDAILMLDRRRGDAAAHCCMQARASDWLRLGTRLAGVTAQTAQGPRRHASAGRILLYDAATGAAVLWVGEGAAPSGLEKLLLSGFGASSAVATAPQAR